MNSRPPKRSIVALSILGAVLTTVAWNAFVLGPSGRQGEKVQAQLKAAEAQGGAMEAELAELRHLADGTSGSRDLQRLGRLIPDTPELADFIRSMDDVAAESHVDWASLVPGSPVPGVGGAPTTIGVDLKVEGTFFQLMDYLRRIEVLERLVVIDSVDLAAPTATGGSPRLTVDLRARLFAVASGGVTSSSAAALSSPDHSPASIAPQVAAGRLTDPSITTGGA